jgi:HAD superfamily hydrolase (TIGR01459 family)
MSLAAIANTPRTAAFPVLPAGLSALTHQYAGYIVDLWGVVHDGVRAHLAAVDVLRRLRAQGSTVCLLSNSPRSAQAIAVKLAEMGIDNGCYDHLLSSGEATIDALRGPHDAWHAGLGREYYFIGPIDTQSLLHELDYTRVEEPSQATFVLNAGSEQGRSIEHYEHLLRKCARLGLRMICANPDLTVNVGGESVMCAGAIARRYEALGGDVYYHGKPHPAVYQRCLQLMKLDARSILGIGDGLETDVAGAHAAGMDAAFVIGGLHAECLDVGRPLIDRLEQLFAESRHRPEYALPYLTW